MMENSERKSVAEYALRMLCRLGSHDYAEEQRHSIASSNVGEIKKVCKRCGKTTVEYNPR